jgi:hypothetical protein
MSHYVLDKTYEVETSGGVPAHRVVVAGSADGTCDLPAAAGADKLLGVTTHAQATQGAGVGVRKLGVALVEAAGAIDYGDRLEIADTQGRVQTISGVGLKHVVGQAESTATAAGDLIQVFLVTETYLIA